MPKNMKYNLFHSLNRFVRLQIWREYLTGAQKKPCQFFINNQTRSGLP